jgi:DNA modification methylase
MDIRNGDCLEVLRTVESNSIDSIVTDPPYGLSFMGKKWDYDVPSVDIWRECLRVLKPGGHLLAFAGSRTYHRMAVNIEDAGFEIRDQVMWLYGSGFPKSLNVSKAIDKALGAEREKVRISADEIRNPKSIGSGHGVEGGDRPWMQEALERGFHEMDGEDPVTEEAKKWDGWGTQLKPAHEPCVLARKPVESSITLNVLEHGVGGINIDGCRIGTEEMKVTASDGVMISGNTSMSGGNTGRIDMGTKTGRFPSNIIHDGSDEVVEIFPETAGAKPHGGDGGHLDTQGMGWGFKRMASDLSDLPGSAARYFYCAKASRAERDEGLSHLPDHTGDAALANAVCQKCLKHRLQSNLARRCTCDDPEWGESRLDAIKNNHPTVKPVALMRYLCRLVTPPGGVVLDPFMGSGTTGVAAHKEGFNFYGIERDPDYYIIAKSRVDYVSHGEVREDAGEEAPKPRPSSIFHWVDA